MSRNLKSLLNHNKFKHNYASHMITSLYEQYVFMERGNIPHV